MDAAADKLQQELLDVIGRSRKRQRDAIHQQLLEEDTRCLEEVKKLTVRFEAKLRDHDTEKTAVLACQPCSGCLAKSEEVKALASQLETALGYRKTCKAQKEQIASLHKKAMALEAEVKDQRARLLHRSTASEPSSTARQLAAVQVELETGRQRILELEAHCKELAKHKEIVKAAYKKERQAHNALKSALQADDTGRQHKVLQETNPPAPDPTSQREEPLSACVPSSQPEEAPQGAAIQAPKPTETAADSNITNCSELPPGGITEAAGTPTSHRAACQPEAVGSQQQPAGSCRNAPAEKAASVGRSTRQQPEKMQPPEKLQRPEGRQSAVPLEGDRDSCDVAAETAGVAVARGPGVEGKGVQQLERVKRKSEELGPSPVRPAVGRAGDGAQRKALRSRHAEDGHARSDPNPHVADQKHAAGGRKPARKDPKPQETTAAALVAGGGGCDNDSPSSKPAVVPPAAAESPAEGPGNARTARAHNGVVESLHILDMQQGAGNPRDAPRRRQLPTIVDSAAAEPAARARDKRRPAVVASSSAAPKPAQQPPGQQQKEVAKQPGASNDLGYKYRDVVRKKAEREQLQGFTCPDCEGFFRAVLSWDKNAKLPTCDHGRGGTTPVKQMIQEGSRHRFRFEPPKTPEGFWDMGFMDSQDSRVQQQGD